MSLVSLEAVSPCMLLCFDRPEPFAPAQSNIRLLPRFIGQRQLVHLHRMPKNLAVSMSSSYNRSHAGGNGGDVIRQLSDWPIRQAGCAQLARFPPPRQAPAPVLGDDRTRTAAVAAVHALRA